MRLGPVAPKHAQSYPAAIQRGAEPGVGPCDRAIGRNLIDGFELLRHRGEGGVVDRRDRIVGADAGARCRTIGHESQHGIIAGKAERGLRGSGIGILRDMVQGHPRGILDIPAEGGVGGRQAEADAEHARIGSAQLRQRHVLGNVVLRGRDSRLARRHCQQRERQQRAPAAAHQPTGFLTERASAIAALSSS